MTESNECKFVKHLYELRRVHQNDIICEHLLYTKQNIVPSR